MNAKTAVGIVLGLVFLGLVLVAALPEALVFPTAAPGGPAVGVAMWDLRTFEVIVQGLILLGGVIAILLLLGSRRSREVSP